MDIQWLDESDVVVVGGGLAALRAALEASKGAHRIHVVTKGQVGRSGASAITSAGYAAAARLPGSPDSPEVHHRDTLVGGAGLNDPRLVRLMCEEGPARLADLVELGARFQTRDGDLIRTKSGDHSFARSVAAVGYRGTELTLPLRERLVAGGVAFLERAMVVDLLRDRGGVAGVLVLDLERGHLLVLPARAVILASGGAGQLYAVTSNPRDLTGDGHALACRTGAALLDMEFFQFLPWRVVAPVGEGGRVSIQMYTFAAGARLVNALGEAFMRRYDPVNGDATTRDVAARAVYSEIRGGKDVRGGVRVDLSGMAHEEFTRLNPGLSALLERRGLDLGGTPLIVAPEAHFYMGGVQIDSDGSTTVTRLFAAGEVVGGIHGANRLCDNAIPETQVFGARAGSAAARAAHSGEGIRPDADQVHQWAERLEACLRRGGMSGSAAALRRRLRQTMWSGAGIVRTASELTRTLHLLEGLEAGVSEMGAANPAELADLLETENLTLVGRALCLAALTREESRGAHTRLDFPDRDEVRWLRSILISSSSRGGLRVEVIPVPGTSREAVLPSSDSQASVESERSQR